MTAPTSLIVDDRRLVAETYRSLLAGMGHTTVVVNDPGVVTAGWLAGQRLDLAFVDLSFPDHQRNGLDVLLTLHDHSPGTRLVILTQADAPFQDLLRCAWDALPLAGAISKDLLPAEFTAAVQQLSAPGGSYVDPIIRLYLPSRRRPERDVEAYRRLIGHAGHAALWVALATSPTAPDYVDVAAVAGERTYSPPCRASPTPTWRPPASRPCPSRRSTPRRHQRPVCPSPSLPTGRRPPSP